LASDNDADKEKKNEGVDIRVGDKSKDRVSHLSWVRECDSLGHDSIARIILRGQKGREKRDAGLESFSRNISVMLELELRQDSTCEHLVLPPISARTTELDTV
jgi:hypothetical protein